MTTSLSDRVDKIVELIRKHDAESSRYRDKYDGNSLMRIKVDGDTCFAYGSACYNNGLARGLEAAMKILTGEKVEEL